VFFLVERLIKEQFGKMKPYIKRPIGIYDINGDVIVSNEKNAADIDEKLLVKLKKNNSTVESDGHGKNYEWIHANGLRVCIISYEAGTGSADRELIDLIKLNIATVLEADKNIFSRRNFYRDILVGNIPRDKIAALCFDYNIPVNKEGYVLIFEYGSGSREEGVENILSSFFEDAEKIYVDESHTAIITELNGYNNDGRIGQQLRGLVDEIRLETAVPVFAGIGTRAGEIFQLKDAYDKAMTALSVGKIFYRDEYVYDYSALGIARLIYSLPLNVCRQFLYDVLPGEAANFFSDKEIKNTVKMFFQSNLNMSVAARELYVHRNTLVYRLDKISKLTGYNLANFDDAVIIKTALMIKDYLDRYAADQGSQGGSTDDKIC